MLGLNISNRRDGTGTLDSFGRSQPVIVAACECDSSSPGRAEQIFAVFHSLSCPISWELVAAGRSLLFQVVVPERAWPVLDRQFAAAYPDAGLKPGLDALEEALATMPPSVCLFASHYRLQRPFYLPLNQCDGARDYDPLLAVLTAMSGLSQGELVAMQLLAVPAGRGWNEKGLEAAARSPHHRLCREKLARPLYKVSLRAASLSPLREAALLRLRGLDSALRQWNRSELNGLIGECPRLTSRETLRCLLTRKPLPSTGMILSTSELAGLWHLPWGQLPPHVYCAKGRRAPAPAHAVEDAAGVPLGLSDYRGQKDLVILKRADRRQHVYILGASQTGKTTIIGNMASFDMAEGRSVIVADPHGDLSLHLLGLVPEWRVDDVIYFDPADTEYPMGFNLLDSARCRPSLVAGELMHLFRLLWGTTWGPRMNDILHNCLLSLLEVPGATLADIPLLLTSATFRQRVISSLSNLAVRQFWEGRFNRWTASQQMESAEPILNKLNAFLADPTLYRIIGQSRSSFNLREVMDRGKILICNLSRGRLGDENATLLGAALLSKIELAAISRADVPQELRRDVYVYVDEFQRMATRSFISMLSELAKYRCSTVGANQYYQQIPEEVRNAIWGNTGSFVSFRVGPDDARLLARYLEPVFSAGDLLALDNYHACVRLTADGQPQRPFSMETFPPHPRSPQRAEMVRALSRERYSRARVEVEAELRSRFGGRGAITGSRVLTEDIDEE